MLLNVISDLSFDTQTGGGQAFPLGGAWALYTLNMLKTELSTPALCALPSSMSASENSTYLGHLHV